MFSILAFKRPQLDKMCVVRGSAGHRRSPLVPMLAHHYGLILPTGFRRTPNSDVLRRRPAQGGAAVAVASCAGYFKLSAMRPTARGVTHWYSVDTSWLLTENSSRHKMLNLHLPEPAP